MKVTTAQVQEHVQELGSLPTTDLLNIVQDELASARAVTALALIYHRAKKPRILNYREYLKSPEWDRVRQRKLRETGNRCTLCPSRKTLQVHHRTYERVGKERMDDLVVLCRKCHSRHHGALV